jgi:hypothetical protein
MKITVLAQQGPEVMDVPPTKKIGEIKADLRRKWSISERDPLNLQYHAVYLEDENSVQASGLPDGATLIMTLRLGYRV